MTPEELKALIVSRLKRKKREALTQPDFVTAWQALNSAKKNQIIQAAVRGDAESAGKGLVQMLDAYSIGLADARADEIIADGSLSLAELGDIFDA